MGCYIDKADKAKRDISTNLKEADPKKCFQKAKNLELETRQGRKENHPTPPS